MLFCYIQMGKVCFLEKYFSGVIFSSKVLWVKKSVGEENVTTQKSMKTKQKIVKMFGAVTLIFAICWLPYHVYFIYSYFFPEIMKVIWSTKWTICTNLYCFCKAWYTQHMFLFFYWLAMFNCCVNPMVYYWRNKRFRDYFNQVLCCRRFLSHRSQTRSSYWYSDTARSGLHNGHGVWLSNIVFHLFNATAIHNPCQLLFVVQFANWIYAELDWLKVHS